VVEWLRRLRKRFVMSVKKNWYFLYTFYRSRGGW
jgi:hypothetical protein